MTHSIISDCLVAVRTHKRDHAQPVGYKLVRQNSRVRDHFHHVNSYLPLSLSASKQLHDAPTVGMSAIMTLRKEFATLAKKDHKRNGER